MSDTRQLLTRISAFRARLHEMPRLEPVDDIASATITPANRLSHVFREAIVSEPAQLTGRAYRLLSEARELVGHQKRLTDDALIVHSDATDPITTFHRGTIGLTESALRLAQTFPAAAEAQLRLCDGFEQLLQVIRDRLAVLEHAIAMRRSDTERIARLVQLLTLLREQKPVAAHAFFEIAELLLDDARQGLRLRILSCDPLKDGAAKFVAVHAMNTAQVLARLVPHDFEWSLKPTLPIVAALVMDAGMLDVPIETLAKSESLTSDERRAIERHPIVSAEWVRHSIPESGPLADVIAAHHERLDGSGYHAGLKASEIATLPRLLAVADVYAARMAERPYRPALDSRSALTETLLDADAGKLDRDFAEYLLHISFHPVGTVVELTDGRTAVVTATHNSRTNLRASFRPVVAILADARGDVLPRPEFVDLAAVEVGSIVRSLTPAERRERLGNSYPDLCI